MERIKRLFGQETAVQWDKVFATQMPRVLNYFRFHGADDAAAEDLTASTFEKAWRARESFRSEKSSVETWLYTIAHRTLIDHFRTHKSELSLDGLEDRPDRQSGSSLEEAAQTAGEHERLRRCLLRLPERDRELIALKYGAEMTNRAIAKQTGLSESNVGTLLNRIMAALRKQLEEEL